MCQSINLLGLSVYPHKVPDFQQPNSTVGAVINIQIIGAHRRTLQNFCDRDNPTIKGKGPNLDVGFIE